MTLKSVSIRSATPQDVPALATLVQRYWEFESLGGFARARIEMLLGDLLSKPDRGACWLAEAQGQVCGYLLAVFVFSLEHGGLMAEIDELFVSDELRSVGAGSLLLARADRDLAERGLTRLQLQLGVHNHRARHFYERHGFARRAGYELLDKALEAT
ncbi:MAG TPA: GNAT family N-acetyltransferase [Steroidobacteraceae bacterium]|jgi:ribosomal protein S18 acetylase RimI-like enzyme